MYTQEDMDEVLQALAQQSLENNQLKLQQRILQRRLDALQQPAQSGETPVAETLPFESFVVEGEVV